MWSGQGGRNQEDGFGDGVQAFSLSMDGRSWGAVHGLDERRVACTESQQAGGRTVGSKLKGMKAPPAALVFDGALLPVDW